ncbi:Galactoside 2-alpha-L-fucosyltransferase [Hordeum vulgare]|nr:Galactoside 2-alpha-L-fucosyltransferase [Hordeum vulgare]
MEAAKKKVLLKRKRAPPTNKAPASSTPATAAIPPVFDGMPKRSEYAAILEENAVNIEDAPLGEYGYNDMDDGVHGGGEEEEEEELQEIGGEVFEASQSTTGYSKRKKGYTQLEDEVLIRAWEAVSLDAIHGTDQTGKRRKLQPEGIETCRHPRGKPFAFEHCWVMLSEKWKVRDKEAPSKKGAFTLLDDEDDDEEERNKGRPDGTKKAKDNMRKDSEASSLREKIDHIVKSNELMVTMTIEAKKRVGNEEVSRERGEVASNQGEQVAEGGH